MRIEEIKGSYTLNYRYDDRGVLTAVSSYNVNTGAVNILYAMTNTRGDVVALYDGDGDIRTRYTYDAWGKVISVTDGDGNALGANKLGSLNSIRYRGYVYDHETGLYYLQSRYYDPDTGRFLNADDVNFIGYSGEVLSYNMFAYCENNAVNGVDSFGCATKKKTKHYIYVYKYDEIDKYDLGHIDFSLDKKIYSYGTVGNADPELDNTTFNKLKGKVQGYLMVSSVKNWQNYLSDKGKEVQDKVKIYLTKDEYSKLKSFLKSFKSDTEFHFKDSKINYNKVIKGTYKYYSFIKANCSTFVRDALYASMPNYVYLASYSFSLYGGRPLLTPYSVFTVARDIASFK